MGELRQAGYELTEAVEAADTIVVNTCSFLQASMQESMDTIQTMLKRKEAGQCEKVIVAGCLVEREREKLITALPAVDGFVGSGALAEVVSLLSDTLAKPVMVLGDGAKLYSHESPRVKATEPWTSYLKIAEGCDHTCAFCTIPKIRGAFRSRPIESLVAEVEGLVPYGLKEVVLVAQDTTMYGLDLYGKLSLDLLLTALSQVKGLEWIRVLYGYPSQLTDAVIQVLREREKVVPYLDMPIQHASFAVLRAMKRGYGKERIRKITEALRKDFPEFALRTTVIVGFPGEQPEQVKELTAFLEEVEFDHLGTFLYSSEPGTVAACLEEQVPDAVKEERYHQVMQLQQRISQKRNQLFLGKTLSVLVESRLSDRLSTYRGRTFRDAPDIDGSVIFQGECDIPLGSFAAVYVTEVQEYDLIGTHVP